MVVKPSKAPPWRAVSTVGLGELSLFLFTLAAQSRITTWIFLQRSRVWRHGGIRREAGGITRRQPPGVANDAHRLAVLDRLYSGDASRRPLETWHLLDVEVSSPFLVSSKVAQLQSKHKNV